MSALKPKRLPGLPDLITRKLYKTGQTRGATRSEIYQNRVSRSGTVLIPHAHFEASRKPSDGTEAYEKGFIVLVQPEWYYNEPQAEERLDNQGLELGRNALLLFERPVEWAQYAVGRDMVLPTGVGLVPASSRLAPLGGNYLARVPGTTAEGRGRVDHGFTSTSSRGAGIRVYEYASAENIKQTRLQLEGLLWLCANSLEDMVSLGMELHQAKLRRTSVIAQATDMGLLDVERLRGLRLLGPADQTICSLCLVPMSVRQFATRNAQAEGRETWDNTTTEASLFHIDELRVGKLQHKPYNLGWGHHHCNVVVKDSGIVPTLEWMISVVEANKDHPTIL